MDEQERVRLVKLVAQGDQDALQRLIVFYHAPLRRAVEARIEPDVRRHIDPDDVLQQAYVSAFKAVSSPNRDRQRAGRSGPRPRAADQSRERERAERSGPRPRAADQSRERERAEGSGPRPRAADRSHDDQRADTPPLHFDTAGGFYKWLEAIAVARLKDQERALRRQKRDVGRLVRDRPDVTASYSGLVTRLTACESTPSRQIAKDEAIAAVMSCLARLNDDQRKVVRLRFLEGKPVAEVAERLGKTEPAIHMLCHRGLKSLRELMVSITRYLTHL